MAELVVEGLRLLLRPQLPEDHPVEEARIGRRRALAGFGGEVHGVAGVRQEPPRDSHFGDIEVDVRERHPHDGHRQPPRRRRRPVANLPVAPRRPYSDRMSGLVGQPAEPDRRSQPMSELPDEMPAAVSRGPGNVVVEERPVPRPGPGEVLIEVDHCGICGSDIHMLLEGWGDKPGRVAGHEYTGAIVALGPGVEGWAVGETVVGGASPMCGRCRGCLAGKPAQCEDRPSSVIDDHDGAFARYTLVRAAALVRLPAGLSPRPAALAEPLAVALHAITRSGAAPGDSVMVMGAGPIGALAIAALKARGIEPITVVEPGERRRELARRLGAPRCSTRPNLRCSGRGIRSASPIEPCVSCWSARAGRPPWRRASTNSAGAAPWSWSERASSSRPWIPTGSF